MKSHATYAGDPRNHATDLAELRAEVERLRAALDFYANPENWVASQVPNAYPSVWESAVTIDGGELARRALNVEVDR